MLTCQQSMQCLNQIETERLNQVRNNKRDRMRDKERDDRVYIKPTCSTHTCVNQYTKLD